MVIIDDKKINCSKKIVTIENQKYIYIPLENKKGEIFTEIIDVNSYVYKYDVVAINRLDNFPIHSPISGIFTGKTKMVILNGKSVLCLIIENDFKEKTRNSYGKKQHITNVSKEKFITLLKDSGIIGLSGSAFATYKKYDLDAKYLVVNGMECEAFSSCDNALMYQKVEEILEAIDAILEINHIPKCYIAICRDNTKIINNFLKYINSYPNIKVYAIDNYYPNGWERNVIREIFHQDYKNYPSEIGIIVNNVSTVYAIYEALKFNSPLVSRVVTISGNGVKRPCNVLVKIGTSLKDVINSVCEYKKSNKDLLFLAGGVINGTCLTSDDVIVTKELTSVIIQRNSLKTTLPCLKCGKCIKYCPVQLKPIFILNNINNSDKLKKLEVDKCIDCGLCSYICPSRIDLREAVRHSKGDI